MNVHFGDTSHTGKPGRIARVNTDSNAVGLNILITPDMEVIFQSRARDGESARSQTQKAESTDVSVDLRLPREGNMFRGFYKAVDDQGHLVGEATIVTESCLDMGIGVSSCNMGVYLRQCSRFEVLDK